MAQFIHLFFNYSFRLIERYIVIETDNFDEASSSKFIQTHHRIDL